MTTQNSDYYDDDARFSMIRPWIGRLDTPEREDAWVKDFIGRLAGILRYVSKS